MKKEIYTIAIMSFSGQPTRIFSVSRNSLIIILIVAVLAVTSGITYGALKIWGTYKKQSQETAVAVHKYETIQKEFQILKGELHKIEKSYMDFKSIMGSQSSYLNDGLSADESESSGLLGKGGSEMPEIKSFSPSPKKIANNLKIDLSSTMKEATSLKSNFRNLIEDASTKIAKLATVPSICPVHVGAGMQYRVTSEYGSRQNPFNWTTWEYHEGLDIASPIGTSVMATADGIITDIGENKLLGNFIIIHHNEKFTTIYGHMNDFAGGMEKGTKVKRRDVIGYVGTTGRSTWYHVHYAVKVDGRYVDPQDYILN